MLRRILDGIAKWLSRDLAPGDICSIRSGDERYGIVKVLALDQDIVHVRLYKQKFTELPRHVEIATLTLGTIHDTDGFGIGHLPLSRSGFAAAWRPVRIQHEPVTEEDLDGYRIYQAEALGDSP